MRWFVPVLCCLALGVQAAVVATDDFNRADGDLGPNWSSPIGSEGNLVITNQQVGVGVENAHCFAYCSADSFNDDQYSQATITTIGPWTGVAVRVDAVQDRFYFAFVFAPNDYRIYLRDGGYYSLATGSSETWQVGDTLRLEVSGSQNPVTVTMYRNGKPVLIWVSTSSDPVKTGGSPGIGIYSRTGAHLMLDNFEGGNLDLDTNAPTVPQGLTVTATNSGQASLSWVASADNVAVAGYLIERCDGGDCADFTDVAATTQTNFTDPDLSGATTYSYRIQATDSAGNLSPYSDVVTVTTSIPVPPSVSVISNQNTYVGLAVGPFPFSVSDPGLDPVSLTVTASSSNQALAPDQNLSIVDLGAQRNLTIVPVDGQVGAATITVTVSNGVNSTNSSFVLTVNPAGWGESMFSNVSDITIPVSGEAILYPSTISVSGVVGMLTNLEVTLHGVSHGFLSDLDVLLVNPNGQGVVLMSATGASYSISNITFSLSDQASYTVSPYSALTPGTFQPTDLAANHTNTPHVFPSPAPIPPFTTNLSTFNGLSPNGSWSLYVHDSGSGIGGNIAGGWTLALRTVSPPNFGSITNLSTWVNTATAPIPFTVSDAETPASNLVITANSSNQTLVPDANILLGGAGTNRTVVLTPVRDQMGTTLMALIVTDGDGMSATNTFSLMVDPAPLTVTVDSFSRPYGITNPLLTGEISGLQTGDDITLSLSTTATTTSPVGLYPITPTLNDPDARLVNYTLTYVGGMLSITQTALTITANDASKVYDGLAYSGGNGVTFAGFVNGDSLGSLTGTLSYTGTSQGAINVGSYTITPGGVSDPNYGITFVDGTLSVTPALSSLALSSQPNPSLPGTNVTFTAVVTAVGSVSTVPTGLIQFRADGLSLGAAIPLVAGVGTLVTNALGHGSHTITAEYSGDPNFLAVTNGSPAAQIVNTPPQAGTNSIIGYENITTQIPARTLAASGSDADMDALTVISVSPTSEAGGTIILVSGTINYAPPTNYIGADSFTYSLSDTYNSSATGTVEVTVKSTEVTLAGAVDISGSFKLAGFGLPNGNYLVQASSDLVHWFGLGTVTADETGAIQFTDSNASGVQVRFYRTVAQ